jgi:hypothetical protein
MGAVGSHILDFRAGSVDNNPFQLAYFGTDIDFKGFFGLLHGGMGCFVVYQDTI